jgi:hypothetical protein
MMRRDFNCDGVRIEDRGSGARGLYRTIRPQFVVAVVAAVVVAVAVPRGRRCEIEMRV